MRYFYSPLLSAALLFGAASVAHAQQEVTLITPGGGAAAFKALIPDFESKTGYKVTLISGSGQGTKKRVMQGDHFDVVVVQPPLADVLASGNVAVGSRKLLASAAIGVAVKKGAPKPDISTAAAVKKLLLSVKSFAYPDPALGAGAGLSLDATLQKLGIADQVKAKAVHAKSGSGAVEATAKGEVEIGLTYLSEIDNPGVDIVGRLPAAISPPTQLVGFVDTYTSNPAGAQALLDYLSSSAARSGYRAVRLIPNR